MKRRILACLGIFIISAMLGTVLSMAKAGAATRSIGWEVSGSAALVGIRREGEDPTPGPADDDGAP